jgi:hypothetical protein
LGGFLQTEFKKFFVRFFMHTRITSRLEQMKMTIAGISLAALPGRVSGNMPFPMPLDGPQKNIINLTMPS